MGRFQKLGFTKKQIEENLDAQNAQALQNVKNLGGSVARSLGLGTDIPQVPMENKPEELKPRPALVGKPTSAGGRLDEVLSKVNEANRAQQLKDLEEAQNAAEFGDEEAALKVAKLKALMQR